MSNKTKNYLLLTPIFGIITFFLLYFLATQKYPCGNSFIPNMVDFDWVYNYWCDLYYDVCPNGKVNHGRPIALTATVILAISIATFCWTIPSLFPHSKSNPNYIRISGIIAMFLAVFIFTEYHDLFMNSAMIFALIALFHIFKGLKTHGFNRLFYFGIFCLFLLTFCFTFYNFGIWMIALPLTQKFAFLFVLIWVGLMNWEVYICNKKFY